MILPRLFRPRKRLWSTGCEGGLCPKCGKWRKGSRRMAGMAGMIPGVADCECCVCPNCTVTAACTGATPCAIEATLEDVTLCGCINRVHNIGATNYDSFQLVTPASINGSYILNQLTSNRCFYLLQVEDFATLRSYEDADCTGAFVDVSYDLEFGILRQATVMRVNSCRLNTAGGGSASLAEIWLFENTACSVSACVDVTDCPNNLVVGDCGVVLSPIGNNPNPMAYGGTLTIRAG